jgi:pimeloyl-ACP methyl ester carboxylesterase
MPGRNPYRLTPVSTESMLRRNPKGKILLRLVVALLGTALALPGFGQSFSTPAPSGPNRVGTALLHLQDTSRSNPFAADGSKRVLVVRFWYPSAANADCQLAEYASPKVWAYVSQVSGFPLPRVTTHSCLNAPVEQGTHPLVVFSHGYTGTFTDSTFLFEDLASRGYGVVSTAHTYESTVVEFPDGRLIKSAFGSYLRGNTLRTDEQSLKLARSIRLADLKFIIDELERLNRAYGLFAGKLDIARVGVMGHSLGGEVALSSLQRDQRLRAAVLLDAPIISEDVVGTVKPVLVVAAGRERWSEQECTLWSNLLGPHLAVNLLRADHLTPTDAVWLFKDLQGFIPSGTVSAENNVALLRSLVAGFLDGNLRGVTGNALLNGALSGAQDTLVTRDNQVLCHQRAAVVKGELP